MERNCVTLLIYFHLVIINTVLVIRSTWINVAINFLYYSALAFFMDEKNHRILMRDYKMISFTICFSGYSHLGYLIYSLYLLATDHTIVLHATIFILWLDVFGHACAYNVMHKRRQAILNDRAYQRQVDEQMDIYEEEMEETHQRLQYHE